MRHGTVLSTAATAAALSVGQASIGALQTPSTSNACTSQLFLRRNEATSRVSSATTSLMLLVNQCRNYATPAAGSLETSLCTAIAGAIAAVPKAEQHVDTGAGFILVPKLLRKLSAAQKEDLETCSSTGLLGLLKKHPNIFEVVRSVSEEGGPGPWAVKCKEGATTEASSSAPTTNTAAVESKEEAPKKKSTPLPASKTVRTAAATAAAATKASASSAATAGSATSTTKQSTTRLSSVAATPTNLTDAEFHELWMSVKPLIAQSPNITQVSPVYSTLDAATRKKIRTNFSTMSGFLRAVVQKGKDELAQEEAEKRQEAIDNGRSPASVSMKGKGTVYNVAISDDGLRACRVFGNAAPPLTLNPPKEATISNPGKGRNTTKSGGNAATAYNSVEMRAAMNDIANSSAAAVEDVRYVYQPDFGDSFEPPESPNPNEISKEEARTNKTGDVISADMLVPLIPPFFVPIEDVLPLFPEGYTADHIKELFATTGAIEIVTLENEHFVRLHGGGSLIDMRGNEATMQHFMHYEPDPSLMDAFTPYFEKKGWTSLRKLVMSVSPEIREQLPYHRYKSLLYFAQMQHRFAFITDEEGFVTRVRNQMSLDFDTSPLPYVINQINKVLGDERKSVETLLEWAVSPTGLGDYGLEMLKKYYGTPPQTGGLPQTTAAAAETKDGDTTKKATHADEQVTETADGTTTADDTGDAALALQVDLPPIPEDISEAAAKASTDNEWSASSDESAILSAKRKKLEDALLKGDQGATADTDGTPKYVVPDDLRCKNTFTKENLWNFFVQHQGCFYCDFDAMSIMRAKMRENELRSQMSLEEKLEEAIAKGEKRDARKIRRKMAIRADPDNPLLDNQKLAEAVASHLPKRGKHVQLRKFLGNLPPSMVDLFPRIPFKLFKGHPELFTLFEYKEPGHLHVMRAGCDLPEGALREEFTEEELIRQCAAALDKPRRMADVWGRLSFGAKTCILKEYKTLFELLKKYPEYFTIVFRDTVKMDARNALVMVQQQPP